MKKQFVLAAVVLATAFTFVSCGKKEAENTEVAADTTAVEAPAAPVADTTAVDTTAATPAVDTAAAPATEAAH